MSEAASSATSGGFGRFVPGFEFLQNLAGGASMAQATPQMPSLGNWVAPTFSVEDIEKRIEELKAVQFWLDQNAKALAATIQALEVQKMTLATLRTMNLSMGDVAQSLGAMVGLGGQEAAPEAPAPTQFAGLEIPERTYGKPAAADGQAQAAQGQNDSGSDTGADSGGGSGGGSAAQPFQGTASAATGVIDPMQWWGALTQQFQQIASTALQDATRQMVSASDGASGNKASASSAPARENAPAPRRAAARKTSTSAKPAKKKAPAKKAATPTAASKKAAAQPMIGGDWPMPTAFFQMPGFTGATQSAPSAGAASARGASSRSTGAKSGKTQTASRSTAKKTTARKTPSARRPR